MRPLVLASSSRYRRAQLARLGLSFEAVAPAVDERSVDIADPAELACALAVAKASCVAASRPGATVVGSDQVASVDGRRFDKPGTEGRARDQLRLLAGRTHTLHTAVALVVSGEPSRVAVARTALTMRPLHDDEIARYVERDQPLDCCGSYRIEALGPALFERIEGDDPTAIEGLPLVALSRLLREAGYPLP